MSMDGSTSALEELRLSIRSSCTEHAKGGKVECMAEQQAEERHHIAKIQLNALDVAGQISVLNSF